VFEQCTEAFIGHEAIMLINKMSWNVQTLVSLSSGYSRRYVPCLQRPSVHAS